MVEQTFWLRQNAEQLGVLRTINTFPLFRIILENILGINIEANSDFWSKLPATSLLRM